MINGRSVPGWDVDAGVAALDTITLAASAEYDQTATADVTNDAGHFTVTARTTFSFDASKVWNRAAFPWREDVYMPVGSGAPLALWGGAGDQRMVDGSPIDLVPADDDKLYIMRWLLRPWLLPPDDSKWIPVGPPPSLLNHSYSHLGNKMAAKIEYDSVVDGTPFVSLSCALSLRIPLAEITVTTVRHWELLSGPGPTPPDETETRSYSGEATASFIRGDEGEMSRWSLSVHIQDDELPDTYPQFGAAGDTDEVEVDFSTLAGILDTGGEADSGDGVTVSVALA